MCVGDPLVKGVNPTPNNMKSNSSHNNELKSNNSNRNKDKSKGIQLKTLHVDDEVRLHDGKQWSIKGVVKEVLDSPRSYLINTSRGTTVRRTRRHIQLTKKAPCRGNNVEEDDDYFNLFDDLVTDIPEVVEQDEVVKQDEEVESDDKTIVPEMFENEEDELQSDDEIEDLMNSMMDLSVVDDQPATYT